MNAMAETLRLALSAAIAASSDAKQCSERMAGKTIAVETLDQRLLITFEAGAVKVLPSDAEADATVRGSPTAVFTTLVSRRETAAILGDEALFEDFHNSFRPHINIPASMGDFAHDAGDAMRVGGRAAQSAVEGAVQALRTAAKDYFADAAESERMAEQIQELQRRVDELEERLNALTGEDANERQRQDEEQDENQDEERG